jgi:hypothetical protein
VPFLAIVHLRALACPDCGAGVAEPGARSFIVDPQGAPVAFDTGDPPAEMIVALACPRGHTVALAVPNEISAEETLTTPENAPLGPDAVLQSGKTESGASL